MIVSALLPTSIWAAVPQVDLTYYDGAWGFSDGLARVTLAVGGEMAKGDGSEKNAALSISPVYKDGQRLYLTAYNINGNNYFKLRDIGKAFNFGVSWDRAANTVVIDTAVSYED